MENEAAERKRAVAFGRFAGGLDRRGPRKGEIERALGRARDRDDEERIVEGEIAAVEPMHAGTGLRHGDADREPEILRRRHGDHIENQS